jgi:hypothetical protein
MADSYRGACFCGAVEIQVTGEPVAMGYCHCASCRHWAAAPVNAFTLWNPQSVEVVRGAEHVGEYHKSDRSYRRWCTRCGGHLLSEHPRLGLIDVYAATIPGFPFKPGVHVNYEDTVLRMRDGLPKLRDFPLEMGGSGQPLAE